MRKKILSLLLILTLLMGMTGTTFASAVNVKGYTAVNPMALNSELKMTDFKTDNGTWKNASIKVSEVQIDNVGYKKINSTQSLKYSDTALRKIDAIRVKVTYTFSGFTGNKESLIKNNLLAERIDALSSKNIYKDGGQFYSGFANGLHNKVEKYTLGGKTYKGEWYNKKIKDVNFTKPVSMSGYVYLIMDKGTTNGAFVNFIFSDKNEVDKSEAYFVFSNKMVESRVKNTGTYIFGDENVGIVNSTFDMNYIPDEEEISEGDPVIKFYRVGTERDPIIQLGLIKSADGFTEKELKSAIEDYAYDKAEDFDLEMKVENGIYVIQGISDVSNTYVNCHIINKGDYFWVVSIQSDINEKALADKLWDSYKATNDLSPAKATSTTGTFVYGTKDYGTFTSSEKMKDFTEEGESLFKYQSLQSDWAVAMDYTMYTKEIADTFATKMDGSNCKKAKLDNGNITVYVNYDDPGDNYIVMTTVKNGKFYFFAIDAVKAKLPLVKIPVIKSYLISLGYSESEVNTMLTDAIFN